MSKHFVVAPGKNLATCLQRKLYGHRKNVLSKWQRGDRVVYYVDGKLAVLGTVTGDPFFNNQETVWPDGLYPYRIEVTPTIVLKPEDWIPVQDEVKQKVVSHLGKYWILLKLAY